MKNVKVKVEAGNKKYGTVVGTCACKHTFQDKQYGGGRRLCNLCASGTKRRCTVCGKEENV